MLNREEIIKDVEKNKIIVIMRGFTTEQLICAVDAMKKVEFGWLKLPLTKQA